MISHLNTRNIETISEYLLVVLSQYMLVTNKLIQYYSIFRKSIQFIEWTSFYTIYVWSNRIKNKCQCRF